MIRSEQARSLARLFLLLFRANTAVLRAGDELVSDLGLTTARWQVLAVLALNQSPLTAPQIAKKMGLTRQGVQQHLNALVELGYLWPGHNREHKRSPVYRLTDAGNAAHAAAERAQTRWLNAVAADLSQDKLDNSTEQLRQVLVKLSPRVLDRRAI